MDKFILKIPKILWDLIIKKYCFLFIYRDSQDLYYFKK